MRQSRGILIRGIRHRPVDDGLRGQGFIFFGLSAGEVLGLVSPEQVSGLWS